MTQPPPAMSTTSAMPSTAGSQAMAGAGNTAGTNWFGGPIYNGAPALATTAALVKAGGGADDFSFKKALESMLGEHAADAEIDKLNKQYGEENVDNFLDGISFAVKDALKRAKEQGIDMPAPADVSGKQLAKALVQAGTAPDGTFWAGYMLDHAISHKLHNQVMADIDAKYSHAADGNAHKILNQTMYDAAQALDMKDVKLASFH